MTYIVIKDLTNVRSSMIKPGPPRGTPLTQGFITEGGLKVCHDQSIATYQSPVTMLSCGGVVVFYLQRTYTGSC